MVRVHMSPLFALLPALILFTACTDVTAPVGTEEAAAKPMLAISDGAHVGNAHFYFLPPMVPAPSPDGTFDGSLFPEIVICLLLSDGTACDSSPTDFPIIFTTATGPGAETLRIVPEDEHYIVNWHTDESGVVPGRTYRINVLVAGTELGFADIQFGTTNKEVKNLSTGGIIGLKDGRTLPIKFRIEEGAVFVISAADGGSVEAEAGAVVLDVPAGALTTTEVGITVEPVSSIPTDQSLIPGSVFDFEPDGTAFSSPATLTLAYDPANLPAGLPENSLTILTEETPGEWVEVPGSTVDEVANTVTASIDGFSGKGVGGAVTTVEVTPSSATLDPAETVQLAATPKNAAGSAVNRKVAWTSLDPRFATVDATGLVTAVDVTLGVRIKATSGSATGFAALSVNFILASISVGEVHSCELSVAGTMFCWGNNNFGELGDGTTRSHPVPRVVSDPATGTVTWASVGAGGGHTCGVTTLGKAFCWGSNFFGGVGNGTITNSSVPVPVSGMLRFRSVSTHASQFHTCGATTTGAAYCWGSNGTGQLGNGTTTNSSVPVPVSDPASGAVTWASVGDLGQFNTCGVTTAGKAFCWGSGFRGELGNGTFANSSVPVPVSDPASGAATWVSVTGGFNFSCGLTTDGVAYCWGSNFSGVLGNGITTNSSVPVPVSGMLRFQSVSANGLHSCGLTTDGAAYCWGGNAHGELGNGSNTDSSVPVPVAGGLMFETVSAGTFHTCGKTTNGAAYCWGNNGSGTLGNGTVTNSSVPVPVRAPFIFSPF